MLLLREGFGCIFFTDVLHVGGFSDNIGWKKIRICQKSSKGCVFLWNLFKICWRLLGWC